MSTNPETNKQAEPVAGANASPSPRLSFGETTTVKPVGNDVESLRIELQQNRVEQGRVKALAEANKAAEAEIARLKAENEALAKVRKSSLDHVDQSLRDVVDEDILRANEAMIQGSNKDLLAEFEKRLSPVEAALKSEHEARMRAESSAMDARIDQFHPNFAAATQPGGQYAEAWADYLAKEDPRTGMKNGEIVVRAYNGQRFEGVNDMIESFKIQSGISRVEGMQGGAFPGNQSPYVSQRGGSGGNAERYTLSQYQAAMDASRKAFTSGKQTAAERQAVLEKYTKALQEGRIINDPSPQVGV